MEPVAGETMSGLTCETIQRSTVKYHSEKHRQDTQVGKALQAKSRCLFEFKLELHSDSVHLQLPQADLLKH